MEAPDKIYIDDLAVVNDCVTKISLKQLPHFSEYIRADIVDETVQTAEDHAYFAGKEKMREELMEWAKEEIGNTSILRSETIETLQKVINKLNSL